jgi:hypothetical protein
MYSPYAARSFAAMEGQLPPEVLTQFNTLFADCRLPLEHRGQVNVQAQPFQGQTLDINQIISSSDNPTYSTLTVTNPTSQFLFDDGDNITHVDGGFTGWFNGVTWWQYAMSYWAYFQNTTIKNLTVEKIIKDGYQFEDIRVLKDVYVTFSFNPSTCEGTVNVDKMFVNIKSLVRNDDAGSNSPAPTGSDDDTTSPTTGPDGQPYPGMTAAPPSDPPIYLNNPDVNPSMAGPQDYSGLKPPFGVGPNDPRLPTTRDTFRFTLSPDWMEQSRNNANQDQDDNEQE